MEMDQIGHVRFMKIGGYLTPTVNHRWGGNQAIEVAIQYPYHRLCKTL